MRACANPYSGPPPEARASAIRRRSVGFRPLQNLGLVVLIIANVVVSTAKAQARAPAITSPSADQALQGQVTITGTTGVSNFASAELDFGYASDPTNTWFLIQTLSQSAEDGTLASWDTTTVTDGNYLMRLRVFTTDGTFQDATVPFEIANYTVPTVASATPAPTNPPSIQIPTPLVIAASATPAPLAIPTPTPLPPNPAAMPTSLVYGGLGRGALFAVAAFLVLGAILLRRRS
jgi:hypothetical protein